MIRLLNHLPHLTCLNLNGCRQLSDTIFEELREESQLRVLCLRQHKISNAGFRRLVRQPLVYLTELDISYTATTSSALPLLQEGTPNLQSLNIVSTKVDDLSSLHVHLPRLTTLNVSHCPLEGRVGLLAQCHTIKPWIVSKGFQSKTSPKELVVVELHVYSRLRFAWMPINPNRVMHNLGVAPLFSKRCSIHGELLQVVMFEVILHLLYHWIFSHGKASH